MTIKVFLQKISIVQLIFTLDLKTLFLNTRSFSHFVKGCKNSSKVSMQPWSPLPRFLRSYPCKNFQEKALVQPISEQKETIKSVTFKF